MREVAARKANAGAVLTAKFGVIEPATELAALEHFTEAQVRGGADFLALLLPAVGKEINHVNAANPALKAVLGEYTAISLLCLRGVGIFLG